MTCAQGLLRLFWGGGGSKLECYGTAAENVLVHLLTTSGRRFLFDKKDVAFLVKIYCNKRGGTF